VRATHSSPNESYIIFTPWDTQPISVSTNALYWKERMFIGGSDTVCNFHHRPINPSGMHLGN